MWVDTGISYHGYASDFGRTWLVSRDPRPSRRQRDQLTRWHSVVDAVLDTVGPGATGRDLTAAAVEAEADADRTPWLRHFYLAHGVGTDSAEMPLVGTDLGPEFDEGIVLASGMVLVLEPVIWDDGECGYRSEDIVAVTDSGYETLSDFPYGPYG
jgi:Xaa-Pro aminopeptidase